MPKTSAIQHPKRDYYLSIHRWQIDICKGNIQSAFILSAMEELFNNLLEQKIKNKGWIFIQYKKLIELCVLPISAGDLPDNLKLLQSLKIISLDVPREIEDINKGLEISKLGFWFKLEAVKINQWIQAHQTPVEKKLDVLDYEPFLALLLFQIKSLRPELPKTEYKQNVIQLFNFWKVVTNHPRSAAADKWLKMISERLKDGYSVEYCAKAILGISYSSHHNGDNGVKYDGVKYIFGDTEKLDRMADIAELHGETNFTAEAKLIKFNQTGKFDFNRAVNPSTGAILK